MATIKSRDQFKDSPEGDQQYWKEEINNSIAELKRWHKDGERIVKTYLDKRDNTNEYDRNFNLFSANTGILKSSLYAKIPKPSVTRMFNDYDDDISRVAAIIMERVLTYELQNDNTFDTNAKSNIEDFLVPGLAAAWVRYDTEVETQEYQITDVVEDEDGNQTQEETTETQETITDEQTPIDYVSWKDFLWSPARTWAEVSWVARRVYMNQDEIVARFGEEAKGLVAMDKNVVPTTNDDNENVIQQGEIFEIWDKTREEVIWISLSADRTLDKKPDPFGLQGFFPCPKPLMANTTTTNLIPTPDYELVRDQYTELNELNSRISNIVSACKVVGVYDKEVKALADVLNADSEENTMIAVEKWAGFSQTGGIKGHVDFMPIEQYSNVLLTLMKSRDLVKAQIYELTGISDILRGSSSPYETAGAQKIKAQYASLRLSAKQHEVAEFFSEVIHLKAQLITKFYDANRIMARVGQLAQDDMPLVPQALQLLQSESLPFFKIKVSVDSLQLPNFDVEKEQRAQALQSIGGFMAQAIPAVKQTPELGSLFMGLLKWSVAGYAATKEIEGLFDTALQKLDDASKQPPPPNPEMIAAQAKAQKEQSDSQLAMAELQLKSTIAQNEFAIEQAKLMLKKEEAMLEREKLQSDTNFKQMDLRLDAMLKERGLDVKRETAHLNASIAANATESAANNVEMETMAKLRHQDIESAKHTVDTLTTGGM